METLIIDSSEDSPQVILNAGDNILEISGRSLPEDVNTFYDPVLSWLREYSGNPAENTIFNFKPTYFNTATAKVSLDILTLFEEMAEKGHPVLVRWHFPDEDEDLREAGEEYSEMVEVPFEMVCYS